jgi:hypothetical protein
MDLSLKDGVNPDETSGAANSEDFANMAADATGGLGKANEVISDALTAFSLTSFAGSAAAGAWSARKISQDGIAEAGLGIGASIGLFAVGTISAGFAAAGNYTAETLQDSGDSIRTNWGTPEN